MQHGQHGAALVAVVAVAVSVFAETRATAAPSDPAARPLVGANYSHFRIRNCGFHHTGVIAYYRRTVVRRQLAAMRANGIETLRTIFWHTTDVRREAPWGVVPSALPEPYRTNLISYLMDVRRAGFRRLTISFGPMRANNPIGPKYRPSKLTENWRVIALVRALAKRYGPSEMHFDLLNEGGSSSGWPHRAQLERYVAGIWRRYVARYGTGDATVSVIADDPTRMENLRSVLVPAPSYWEIHLPYDPDAAATAVTAAHAILGAPLVVGETAYNDPDVAAAIRPYPLDEVIEWPLRRERPCKRISETPPYTATAYAGTDTPSVQLLGKGHGDSGASGATAEERERLSLGTNE